MRRALKTGKDVPDAMSVSGLGGIDFLQGSPGVVHPTKNRLVKGSGVSHLVEQRNMEGVDGRRVALAMPRVIQRGERGAPYGPAGAQRMNITLGEYTAVLSQHGSGRRGWWLLTGWKR